MQNSQLISQLSNVGSSQNVPESVWSNLISTLEKLRKGGVGEEEIVGGHRLKPRTS